MKGLENIQILDKFLLTRGVRKQTSVDNFSFLEVVET